MAEVLMPVVITIFVYSKSLPSSLSNSFLRVDISRLSTPLNT